MSNTQPCSPLTAEKKQELAQRARAAEREARTSSEPIPSKGAMLLFCQAATPTVVLSLISEAVSPWELFYRDGKTIGEIESQLGWEAASLVLRSIGRAVRQENEALQGALEQEHRAAAANHERAHYAERALSDIRDMLKDQSDGRNHVLEVEIPCLIDSVIGVELKDKGEASFRQDPDDNDLPF